MKTSDCYHNYNNSDILQAKCIYYHRCKFIGYIFMGTKKTLTSSQWKHMIADNFGNAPNFHLSREIDAMNKHQKSLEQQELER